jgi:Protein of unknown function (DUF4256)
MNNIKSDKKELSSKQREELLRTLKGRFEKNMNRHKEVEWAKVQAKLETNAEKLWSLKEMERSGGEPMLLVMTKKPANTFFVIVQRKVPKAAEVFVMTAKRWSRGKNTNRKIALSIWQLPWVLSF